MNDLEALKYEVDQLKQQIRVSLVVKDQYLCLCLLFFCPALSSNKSDFDFLMVWLVIGGEA